MLQLTGLNRMKRYFIVRVLYIFLGLLTTCWMLFFIYWLQTGTISQHLPPQTDDKYFDTFEQHTTQLTNKLASDKEWERCQNKRRQTLESTCISQNLLEWTGNLEKLLSTDHGQYLVSEKHKTIFCAIPKVASSSLKAVVANVTGKLLLKAVQRHPDIVHKRFVYVKGGIKELRQFSYVEIGGMIKKYKKFLFVRHPIIRLVSAYRNKIETGRYWSHNKTTLTNAMSDIQWTSHKWSFPKFVEWLLAEHQMDPHWDHYYRLCLPCFMHYDYIGKVDTMNTDLFHIMNKSYGLNKAQLAEVRSINSAHHRTERVIQLYLDQLPLGLLGKLWQFYDLDLQMFGYKRKR